jgi:hypothetical protein
VKISTSNFPILSLKKSAVSAAASSSLLSEEGCTLSFILPILG